MKKKGIFSLLFITFILVAIMTGGTMAYFTDKEEQKSTMTIGNLDITLHEYTDENNTIEWDDQIDGKLLVPGDSITKKPVVTIEEHAVSSYIFMQIEGANTMVQNGFTISGLDVDNWQKLDNVDEIDGVYVYIGQYAKDFIVQETTAKRTLPPLFTTVTYNIDNMERKDDIAESLVINAYAIQSRNITNQSGIQGAKEAWKILESN